MNKKKILIVGNAFYPINSPRSFRTTELAKEFSRQGHIVTVIIPKIEDIHNQFEKDYNIKIKDLGTKKYNDTDTSNGSKLLIFFKRVFRKASDYFFHFPTSEWFFMVKKALVNEKGYDLLITIAHPHPIHWGTALVWNKSKIAKTWVADCGDPFMGNRIKKPFYFKYIEKYWCERVDYISVPFEGASNAYYKEFRDKIRIIPQGFNFNEVKVNKEDYKKHKIPTFAYAGGLMLGIRDPKYFLEYLLSLKNYDFKFILYTKSIDIVKDYVNRSEGKIEIRDYIPRKDLIKVLSKMDFIVNFNNSVSIQLPSKLIDYYLTERPVLSVDSGESNKEVVREFLEGDYHNQLIYNNTDQYKIENVANKFLSLIK